MGKMAVPSSLAVSSPLTISALRFIADRCDYAVLCQELRTSETYLEMDRARFDICRSTIFNSLRYHPEQSIISKYNFTNIELMIELETYYEDVIINRHSNSQSTMWSELVSSSVTMRSFIYL